MSSRDLLSKRRLHEKAERKSPKTSLSFVVLLGQQKLKRKKPGENGRASRTESGFHSENNCRRFGTERASATGLPADISQSGRNHPHCSRRRGNQSVGV